MFTFTAYCFVHIYFDFRKIFNCWQLRDQLVLFLYNTGSLYSVLMIDQVIIYQSDHLINTHIWHMFWVINQEMKSGNYPFGFFAERTHIFDDNLEFCWKNILNSNRIRWTWISFLPSPFAKKEGSNEHVGSLRDSKSQQICQNKSLRCLLKFEGGFLLNLTIFVLPLSISCAI